MAECDDASHSEGEAHPEPQDDAQPPLVLDPPPMPLLQFTTAMIRNIPNRYSQKLLRRRFNEANFARTYDFFYLPIDFKSNCNLGYAFINFIKPETLIEFTRQLHGKGWWPDFNSNKICAISIARIQGKAANVAHFQQLDVMSKNKNCRPLVFYSDGPNVGNPEPFRWASTRPAPEKAVRESAEPRDSSSESELLRAAATGASVPMESLIPARAGDASGTATSAGPPPASHDGPAWASSPEPREPRAATGDAQQQAREPQQPREQARVVSAGVAGEHTIAVPYLLPSAPQPPARAYAAAAETGAYVQPPRLPASTAEARPAAARSQQARQQQQQQQPQQQQQQQQQQPRPPRQPPHSHPHQQRPHQQPQQQHPGRGVHDVPPDPRRRRRGSNEHPDVQWQRRNASDVEAGQRPRGAGSGSRTEQQGPRGGVGGFSRADTEQRQHGGGVGGPRAADVEQRPRGSAGGSHSNVAPRQKRGLLSRAEEEQRRRSGMAAEDVSLVEQRPRRSPTRRVPAADPVAYATGAGGSEPGRRSSPARHDTTYRSSPALDVSSSMGSSQLSSSMSVLPGVVPGGGVGVPSVPVVDPGTYALLAGVENYLAYSRAEQARVALVARVASEQESPLRQQLRAAVLAMLFAIATPLSARVTVIGSVALGVQDEASILDVLVVSPRTPEYVATVLVSSLVSVGIMAFQLLPDDNAFVPKILIQYQGAHAAVYCAHQDATGFSQDMESRVMLGTGRQGLETLFVVAQNRLSIFQFVFRVVRLWARARGIFGRDCGFLGGAAWIILVACTFGLFTGCTDPFTLLANFFRQWAVFDWNLPVFLVQSRRSPKPSNRKRVCAIYAPSEPLRNEAFTVSESTLRIIQTELRRAATLISIGRFDLLLETYQNDPADDLLAPGMAALFRAQATVHQAVLAARSPAGPEPRQSPSSATVAAASVTGTAGGGDDSSLLFSEESLGAPAATTRERRASLSLTPLTTPPVAAAAAAAVGGDAPAPVEVEVEVEVAAAVAAPATANSNGASGVFTPTLTDAAQSLSSLPSQLTVMSSSASTSAVHSSSSTSYGSMRGRGLLRGHTMRHSGSDSSGGSHSPLANSPLAFGGDARRSLPEEMMTPLMEIAAEESAAAAASVTAVAGAPMGRQQTRTPPPAAFEPLLGGTHMKHETPPAPERRGVQYLRRDMVLTVEAFCPTPFDALIWGTFVSARAFRLVEALATIPGVFALRPWSLDRRDGSQAAPVFAVALLLVVPASADPSNPLSSDELETDMAAVIAMIEDRGRAFCGFTRSRFCSLHPLYPSLDVCRAVARLVSVSPAATSAQPPRAAIVSGSPTPPIQLGSAIPESVASVALAYEQRR